MLTPKTKAAADALADAISGKVTLTVRPGTPLAALMDVTIDSQGNDVTHERSIAGVNLHDHILQESMIRVTMDYLHKSQHRARSVVLPIINDVMEDAHRGVQGRIAEQTQFKITRDKYSPLMDVPSFLSMTDIDFAYEGILSKSLPSHLLPEIDFNAVTDLMKVNVGKIDEAGKSYLNNSFAQKVWVSVSNDFEGRLTDTMIREGREYAPGAFYVLKCILLNEEALDISLQDSVRLYIEAACALLAARIRFQDSRRKAAIETGNVIESYSDLNIRVNGDNYNRYLKDGGTPEAVMGAALMGRGGVVTRDYLFSHASAIVETYDAYVASQQAQLKSMRAEAYRVVLPQALFDYVKDMEEYKGRIVELRESIWAKMDMVALNEADIYPAVRQLVCTVLYPKADTLKVLSRMDELLRNNPDMDSADASTACYSSLLVDYLLSQVIVSDC